MSFWGKKGASAKKEEAVAAHSTNAGATKNEKEEEEMGTGAPPAAGAAQGGAVAGTALKDNVSFDTATLLAKLEQEKKGREAAEAARQAEAARHQVETARRQAAEHIIAEKLNFPLFNCFPPGTPFTKAKFFPAWNEYPRGESQSLSISTRSPWLVMGPDDVALWPNVVAAAQPPPVGEDPPPPLPFGFASFLEQCHDFKVMHNGVETSILDVVKEGKVNEQLRDLLNGNKATLTAQGELEYATEKEALNARIRSSVETDDNLNFKMLSLVWYPLLEILGGDTCDAAKFPVANYMRMEVGCGGQRTLQHFSFVPLPDHFDKFYMHHKVIHMEPKVRPNSPVSVFPAAEETSTEEQRTFARRSVRILVEAKVDAKCPMPKWLEASEDVPNIDEANSVIGGNLVDYMTSRKYFDPEFNPVARAVSYALAIRSRVFMIHTLNRITFGYIGLRENGTKPFVWLSKTFDCASREPWLPERPEWSTWEILIRFILSSRSHWYLHKFPDSLKEPFRAREEVARPPRRGGGEKRHKKQKRNDEEDQAEATDGFILERFWYADLWAPLRFAVPATHSIEEECSPVHLPGDAELIGDGRMGPVYRLTLQGRDAVVKLAIFSAKRYYEDLRHVYPVFLRDEMAVEFRVYEHLKDLQGKTIPVLLRYDRDFVPNMADAITTDFRGRALEGMDYLEATPSQKLGALRALESLHARGVLHGDVALRNFVCDEHDVVRVIDFGFSRFRQKMEDEEEWNRRSQREVAELRFEFGMVKEEASPVGSRKRPFEGKEGDE